MHIVSTQTFPELFIGETIITPEDRPSQAVGHMLTGYWVGIAVQIPAGLFFAGPWQGAHIGQCVSGLLVAPELGIACDQDKGAVSVRPDAAS